MVERSSSSVNKWLDIKSCSASIWCIFSLSILDILRNLGGGNPKLFVHVGVEPRVQDIHDINLALDSVYDLGFCVQQGDLLLDISMLCRGDQVGFVKEDDVCELDLVHHELSDGSNNITLVIGHHAAKVGIEISLINDGDTSIQSGHFSKLRSFWMFMINLFIIFMIMVMNFKEGCNFMGFRHTRSLNHNVVELLLLGELNDLGDQVGLESA